MCQWGEPFGNNVWHAWGFSAVQEWLITLRRAAKLGIRRGNIYSFTTQTCEMTACLHYFPTFIKRIYNEKKFCQVSFSFFLFFGLIYQNKKLIEFNMIQNHLLSLCNSAMAYSFMSQLCIKNTFNLCNKQHWHISMLFVLKQTSRVEPSGDSTAPTVWALSPSNTHTHTRKLTQHRAFFYSLHLYIKR